MSKLLEGVRVIESAVLLNGDYLGMLLADLGADVIKLERPARGDYIRQYLGQITPDHSPAHVQVNRNKRSLTLDLGQAKGRDVFWRLLDTADVFVDGHAGGVCDRLGIGPDAQLARKSGLIYCQVSGFGTAGRYASIPTHGEMQSALVAAKPRAMGEDGFVKAGPIKSSMGGTTVGARASSAAGLFAIQYVLAALVRRDRTGEGAFIDVSGADAVAASAWMGVTYDLNEHRLTDRSTMPAPLGLETNNAKYQFYETADHRFVLFCPIELNFWQAFCKVVDRPDLVGDQSDETLPDFGVADDALRRKIQEIFHLKPLEEWMRLAVEHYLPIAPAHSSLREALEDPHMRDRRLFVEAEHPGCGPFTFLTRPALIDNDEFALRYAAPALGEHTDEVLSALGIEGDELAALKAARTV